MSPLKIIDLCVKGGYIFVEGQRPKMLFRTKEFHCSLAGPICPSISFVRSISIRSFGKCIRLKLFRILIAIIKDFGTLRIVIVLHLSFQYSKYIISVTVLDVSNKKKGIFTKAKRKRVLH